MVMGCNGNNHSNLLVSPLPSLCGTVKHEGSSFAMVIVTGVWPGVWVKGGSRLGVFAGLAREGARRRSES